MRPSQFSRVVAALLCAFAVILPAFAETQAPPGYRVVNVSNQPPFQAGFCQYARINRHGDIVYEWWRDPYDQSTVEVMLYRDGEVHRITNNTVYDRVPFINDSGDIAWSSATGPNGELEVWVLHEGQATRVSRSNDRGGWEGAGAVASTTPGRLSGIRS